MAFNVTGIPSYHLHYSHYANLDIAKVSWLELQYAAWYVWWANDILATGVLTFIVHELVYFGRALPWVIIDAIPYFKKWKLQPNKLPSVKEQWECTKLVLLSHFTMEMPMILFFQPVAERLGMQTWQIPFPTARAILTPLAFFFVYEDLFHYFAHQLLHTPYLYKHIHKLHHRFSAPFGLAAEYAHPLETMILGTGTISPPLLWCYFGGSLHIIAVHIWVTLRLFQAIDAHSGYDFPWSLHNILPFWSGADHHDFHHMSFTNNYSTSFRWWDYIFGTDDKYRAYKRRLAEARQKQQQLSGKNGVLSKEEERAIERRLLLEVEKEGLRVAAEVESGGKKSQ